MRHIAVECGLGAIGKNSLLLNPHYGSMLIIGAVLTDLQLESDDYCKNICISGCTKCMDACPANAIYDYQVNQKACRLNAYGNNKRGFATVECNSCRTICPMRFGE
jgi:epoxyqueuosine reductase QueG